MGFEFRRISSAGDFVKAVEDGFTLADERASFLQRVAERAAERELEIERINARRRLGAELVQFHSLFVESLDHFTPQRFDGSPNPHFIPQDGSDAARRKLLFAFEMAVKWDICRAHLIKACDELGLLDKVTPGLLAVLSRQPKLDGRALPAETVMRNAHETALRIVNLIGRMRHLETYDPDPKILEVLHEEHLGPVLLGDSSPAEFMEIARTIPIYPNLPDAKRYVS